MSDSHPMLLWAEANGKSVKQIREAAGCSDAHLRNIFAWRKEPSLGLAKRLSDFSGGTVPIDAFLKCTSSVGCGV
jgi:hypothetical protein